MGRRSRLYLSTDQDLNDGVADHGQVRRGEVLAELGYTEGEVQGFLEREVAFESSSSAV